jgi:thioredoxin-like negative regulator of GroEL
MTFFLIAFLLQSQFVLPSRTALENPAARTPVPKQVQKDYDKQWKRFLTGKEDPKISKDLDKLLKKNADVMQLLIVQSYLDLYAGRQPDAERKFQIVVSRQPSNPIALYYLAEFAYSRGDFVKAAGFYARLKTADPAMAGVELKSQRALLLAMETFLQEARRATSENRLGDAERSYRQALQFAPGQPVLRQQLAEVLFLQGKDEEARQLAPGKPEASTDTARAEVQGEQPALEDLGRWGSEIDHFREIRVSPAITRDQFAALLARYFPQIEDFRQAPQVLTDVQGSWAESAIQTVVAAGLLDPMPNHTFQPAKTVTRGEFARTVSRLTRLLRLSATDHAPISPLDVVPNSTLYRELQPVLSFSLLSLDNAGNFNVSAPVGGEEAVNTAEKLLRLIAKNSV